MLRGCVLFFKRAYLRRLIRLKSPTGDRPSPRIFYPAWDIGSSYRSHVSLGLRCAGPARRKSRNKESKQPSLCLSLHTQPVVSVWFVRLESTQSQTLHEERTIVLLMDFPDPKSILHFFRQEALLPRTIQTSLSELVVSNSLEKPKPLRDQPYSRIPPLLVF